MRHCALCFSLRKPSASWPAISSASSPKVGMPRSLRRSAIGSAPLRASLRPAIAFSRASASVTSGKEPKPISRALPCQRKRKTHFFAPEDATANCSPPPSPYLPGLAVSTFRAVSLPIAQSTNQSTNQDEIVSDNYGRVKAVRTKNHADSNNLVDNDGRVAPTVRRRVAPPIRPAPQKKSRVLTWDRS